MTLRPRAPLLYRVRIDHRSRDAARTLRRGARHPGAGAWLDIQETSRPGGGSPSGTEVPSRRRSGGRSRDRARQRRAAEGSGRSGWCRVPASHTYSVPRLEVFLHVRPRLRVVNRRSRCRRATWGSRWPPGAVDAVRSRPTSTWKRGACGGAARIRVRALPFAGGTGFSVPRT